ncbi:MAG TPA: HEAT repeat domain-containing protein [Geminicoccaceae bacterium]|nr:HEAT repeat domain-containing protein [Geminicoccaceae bacterium]
MRGRQLDLFAATGIPPASPLQPKPGRPELVPADLDDAAVIDALPWAGMAEAAALADEAGRRRLVAAVPALVRLCRRFAGFGRERAVPEQVAALHALALIGGAEAARAVARLIAEDAVQGPTRKVAVGIAAQLGSALPAGTVLALLRDADPDVRAAACRCTGSWPAVVPVLIALMDDGDSNVRVAALCALGRMGRREVGPALTRLLRDAPSPEVIESIPGIADEDCIVLLGRLARTRPTLAGAALDALRLINHPRARQIAAALDAGRRG